MDGLTLNGCANLSDFSVRRLLLGFGVVVLGSSNDALIYKLLLAAVSDARQIAVSFGGSQLRSLLTSIQLHEYVTRVHRLA